MAAIGKRVWILLQKNKLGPVLPRFASNRDVTLKRDELFSKELERQNGLISRVEKIEVNLIDASWGCKMMMNKHISTPFDCARHVNEMLTTRSVLALVNDEIWDLHRPLKGDCSVKFLHFKEDDPMAANLAYWRSCSFLLGKTIERAFKDNFYVELCSWPKANLYSGSFVYDIDIKMKDWKPKPEELRTLTGIARRLAAENLKFERLTVDPKLALLMFEDNRFKSQQIPNIASQRQTQGYEPSVVLYRLGDHVDISNGPMISSSAQFGSFSITAAHPIEVNDQFFYRFQGVSLPATFPLNSFAYKFLCERASNLNLSGLNKPSVKFNKDLNIEEERKTAN